MSTGILFGLSESQLDAFASTLDVARTEIARAETDEHKRGDLARNLAGLIQQCEEIPRLLRLHCHSVMDMIPAHAIDNYEETGNELQRAFDRGREILEGVAELARRFQTAGGAVRNADNVQPLLAETKRMEAAFFEHWPRFEPGDAAKALEEYARGECVEIDDAFAQIKDLTRDAWLEQVSKRKAQLQK